MRLFDASAAMRANLLSLATPGRAFWNLECLASAVLCEKRLKGLKKRMLFFSSHLGCTLLVLLLTWLVTLVRKLSPTSSAALSWKLETGGRRRFTGSHWEGRMPLRTGSELLKGCSFSYSFFYDGNQRTKHCSSKRASSRK